MGRGCAFGELQWEDDEGLSWGRWGVWCDPGVRRHTTQFSDVPGDDGRRVRGGDRGPEPKARVLIATWRGDEVPGGSLGSPRTQLWAWTGSHMR